MLLKHSKIFQKEKRNAYNALNIKEICFILELQSHKNHNQVW